MSSLESISTDIIVDLIIGILPIAIIWFIWRYVFKIKLTGEKQENPEFNENKIELTGKKQENKPKLYINIFFIIIFSIFHIFVGLGAWPVLIIYIIIVFGELIVFSKFKNENVTWTQITGFIAMILFGSSFLLALFIAGNSS